MLIQKKIGNMHSWPGNKKNIDWLELEWYESNKRILRKKTRSGIEVVMKFLGENQNLTQGDVIYEDEESMIVIDIRPCETIVVTPKSMFEMAAACYEIGNKHLPLFFQDDELLIAFEAPLFNLLAGLGYHVKKQNRKLLNALKTSVVPDAHLSAESFSKFNQLSTPAK